MLSFAHQYKISGRSSTPNVCARSNNPCSNSVLRQSSRSSSASRASKQFLWFKPLALGSDHTELCPDGFKRCVLLLKNIGAKGEGRIHVHERCRPWVERDVAWKCQT